MPDAGDDRDLRSRDRAGDDFFIERPEILQRAAAARQGSAGSVSPRWPGLTKIPIVTGISCLWIRLSKTTGTRYSCSTFTYLWPSWKTITAAGRAASYCAGT